MLDLEPTVDYIKVIQKQLKEIRVPQSYHELDLMIKDNFSESQIQQI
jgi:hypothetical protein